MELCSFPGGTISQKDPKNTIPKHLNNYPNLCKRIEGLCDTFRKLDCLKTENEELAELFVFFDNKNCCSSTEIKQTRNIQKFEFFINFIVFHKFSTE